MPVPEIRLLALWRWRLLADTTVQECLLILIVNSIRAEGLTHADVSWKETRDTFAMKHRSCDDVARDQAMRGIWLIRLSALVAVAIEVMPFEIQLIWFFLSANALSVALAVKLTCLVLIFFPLMIYVGMHGLRSMWLASSYIAVIGVIVAINLALNTLMILGWARSNGVI